MQLDYDRQGHSLYWLAAGGAPLMAGAAAGPADPPDDDNCTIYTMPYGGGEKVHPLPS